MCSLAFRELLKRAAGAVLLLSVSHLQNERTKQRIGQFPGCDSPNCQASRPQEQPLRCSSHCGFSRLEQESGMPQSNC